MRPSDLDPERWRRVDRILDAILDAPPDERAGVLSEACEGDDGLRAEVEALIAAHDRSETRFDEPASLLAAAILESSKDGPGQRQVGPFRILREIGRGGMGVVYLAEDARLGRYVALKALPPYLGVGRQARRRFATEARAVSTLDHPNIATLYEIDETEEGQLYMVFAFYDGETLDHWIARSPHPVDRTIEIATGIARGLGAAHANGIIHRDVKPSNVLLTRDGGVKLLDFGVAKVVGEDQTGEGVRLGTVGYMSPEHARAEQLDGRTDLWSLGVVLYEMLTGVRPFRSADSAMTLEAILHEQPDPPSTLRSELPDALGRIVQKLLSKTPDGRYQSSEDLLSDLEAVRIGRSPSVAIRDPPPAVRPRIERVAVLPLANLTGDPGQQHVAHGAHDALIAELGKIRALGVLSRTSVMRFQETDLSMPEIAEQLDVDALVEGSVARDGDRLAITAQLIAASPERHLWAQTYRRGLGDVLDVAGEIARSIARELGITLSPAEATRLATTRVVNPAAYEAFTLGQVHLERRSPQGLQLARKYLRRAIEIDPGFAPAYAALAEAVGSGTFFGHASPAEGLPITRSLVEKALALDGTLPAAHTGLGAVTLFGDWDWAGAEEALRQAISLNPSYAYAHFLLAKTLSVQGRYREALAAAERNSELEQYIPFSAFGPVIVLIDMRDYDRAIERARAGIEFFTEFWQGHWLLARAFAGKGLHDEAIMACENAAEISRRTPVILGSLGSFHALTGRRDAALALAAELTERSEAEYVGASNFAIIHAGLGDLDAAFEFLDAAYRERDMALVDAAHDVLFDPLRPDPRFTDLLARMELDG